MKKSHAHLSQYITDRARLYAQADLEDNTITLCVSDDGTHLMLGNVTPLKAREIITALEEQITVIITNEMEKAADAYIKAEKEGAL